MEPVRSVISKQSTAPSRFWSLRLVTSNTSPSTTTLPEDWVSPDMGSGDFFMLRPMSTAPSGFEPCGLLCLGSFASASLGYSAFMLTLLRP